MLQWNSDISKRKGTSLWIFVPPKDKLSRFLFFLCGMADRHKCCQLSSTDDSRQFITLSVTLSVINWRRASTFVYDTMDVTQRVARVRLLCDSCRDLLDSYKSS